MLGIVGAIIEGILWAVVNVYVLLIIVYVIMTYVTLTNKTVQDIFDFLEKVCEPYLKLFRKLIPPISGKYDITPIIAVVVLEVAATILSIIL